MCCGYENTSSSAHVSVNRFCKGGMHDVLDFEPKMANRWLK